MRFILFSISWRGAVGCVNERASEADALSIGSGPMSDVPPKVKKPNDQVTLQYPRLRRFVAY